MDHFVVSARKYRPSTFSTVVGQQSITTTLKNAIRNNHLAQAFLFCGPRGVGKTTCARILAKTINCTNLTSDTEGCNTCESCISFNNGQSLNIFELDAASNNSVDDMRSLVEQVRYPPQSGRYKIYIIDEVHMLSTQAFNAFLKTLEEPPAYAIFILATTEKHKIIPTILSRCQIFDFNRITTDDIAKHLAHIAKNESVHAETEALQTIAQKADGALRDALSIFDQIVSYAGDRITYKDVITNLNILDYEYYFKITDFLRSGSYTDVLLLLNEIIADGFDVHHFIAGLSSHFRNLLVCKEPKTISLLETSEASREKYKAQASVCSYDLLLRYLELANRCDIEFKTSQNQRLLTELTLLKMCGAGSTGESDPHPVVKKKQAESPPEPATRATGSVQGLPVLESTTPPAPAATPEKAESGAPPGVAEKPSRVASEAAPVKKSVPSRGTISISKKLKPEVPAEPTETIAEVREAEPVSEIQVQDAVRTFAENQLQEGKKQLSVALGKHPVRLDADLVIHIDVDNEIQAEEIRNHRNEMLGYLKTNLKNHGLSLRTSVVEATGSGQTAYTPAEKFQKMAEKNPDLNQLKQQFGLEFDF